MANKDLFKQAIAEAKSVREAAIANAKDALEETLTPHLKDMLAAKLQEMEDKDVDEEVVNEIEDEVEEGSKDDKDEAIDENLTEVEPVGDADEDEAEDDSEESEDEAEEIEDAGEEAGEEAVNGDEDLGDLTVDQFKGMIRDIIAQEMGGGEEEMGMDMDGGDIEGLGDEPELEEPADDMEVPGEDEEEIDLDELLAELEAHVAEDKDLEEDATANSTTNQESANHSAEGTHINRVVNEDELKEALDTIEQLKKDLHETNLLNSKLLYVNKIFKANNLNEAQKVNVIAAFDKAETVKEVKLVFETVSENVLVNNKEQVSESKVKGMASKATGTTASKPGVINEVSDTVRRMQKLAGIIK
ncbi:MAG: hypothetical protein ACKVJK_03000 [Methylophagaceae bacterium]